MPLAMGDISLRDFLKTALGPGWSVIGCVRQALGAQTYHFSNGIFTVIRRNIDGADGIREK